MQRTYTYNELSGVLEIIETDGSKSYMPFTDFFADLCQFAGIGFGKNGIITSTGPFSGEMKMMTDKVIKGWTKHLVRHLEVTGELDDLLSELKPHIDLLRRQITDVEIDCRLQMFQSLRESYRSNFCV